MRLYYQRISFAGLVVWGKVETPDNFRPANFPLDGFHPAKLQFLKLGVEVQKQHFLVGFGIGDVKLRRGVDILFKSYFDWR